ncbi:MAG: PaaI family thioesterase, partial [Pseudomonadota bacterium]
PMVQQINIAPVSITENGALFRVPESPFIARSDGIICGQATSSIADTVGVLALFAHNTPQRFMTTVDMTSNFMRPLQNCELDVEAIIQSNGKRMANVRVEIRQENSNKLAMASTCTYAYV